ncbi:methylamine utilization protein [Stutzerimonas urumqiensis]|uniref:methylamine utilization protein n=1 Tax=Stutzerimonas urumqiensis TaxID=638269 RepID=UPI003DA22C31
MSRTFIRRLVALGVCLLAAPVEAGPFSATLVDAQGAPLEHAVLSLHAETPAGTPAPAVLDQIDKQFVPYVLSVRRGSAVSFPNRDDIRHQVYSFSEPKRFELRLYQGTPSEPVVFDQPGVVVLGCNIHDWMLGYVYVTDDPWHAVSDAQGRVRFDDLPPGRYRVTLWHPQSPAGQPQPAGELAMTDAALDRRFTLDLASPPVGPPTAPAASPFADAFQSKSRAAQP